MLVEAAGRAVPLLAVVAAPVIWLVALPFVASPLVFALGRRAGPGWARGASLVALLATWAVLVIVAETDQATAMLGAVVLRADALSVLVVGLTLALVTLVVLADGRQIRAEPSEAGTHLAVMLAAVGAGIGLACAGDLFNLWVWFEVLALASYALVCLERDRPAPLSATVTYLVQGAAGSTLALLGIALVLGQTGTVSLEEIRASAAHTPTLLAAGALLLVGFGVKGALVPLHTWLPDVYSRAPGGASALLAGIITKLSLLAVLRALASLAGVTPTWGVLLLVVGTLNILVGNLLALRQVDVRRLLACSSLAHIGYILLGLGIGVYSGAAEAAQGGLFHFLTHGLMVALAFLAVSALATAVGPAGIPDGRGLRIADLAGAVERRPLVALALVVGVLGLGGLPPLAGFMSEWQIFAAGVETRDPLIVGLVAFAACNVVLSLVYYAPLVGTLFRHPTPGTSPFDAPPDAATRLSLAALVVAIVVLGLWPGLALGLTAPAGAAVLAAFGA